MPLHVCLCMNFHDLFSVLFAGCYRNASHTLLFSKENSSGYKGVNVRSYVRFYWRIELCNCNYNLKCPYFAHFSHFRALFVPSVIYCTHFFSFLCFIYTHTHTHTIVLLYCFLDALTFKLAPLHCNRFDIGIFIGIKFNVLDVRHQR